VTAPRPLVNARTASLDPFVAARVFNHADVQVADAVARAVPGLSDPVLLAVALAVRATRMSHVCVVLGDLPGSLVLGEDAAPDHDADDAAVKPLDELSWPSLDKWTAAFASSHAVAMVDPAMATTQSGVVDGVVRPLVFDGTRLYLERYWRLERMVGDDLVRRADSDHASDGDAGGAGSASNASSDVAVGSGASTAGSAGLIAGILDQLFGPHDGDEPDRQRQAAEAGLERRLVVLAGGPGTGKTHTVSRLLAATYAVAQHEGRTIKVSLAAPTGKAADRMTEAVHQSVAEADIEPALAEPLLATEATTIHRLLGGGGDTEFRHHRDNPLAADIVVVDEASMISLPLMARLLDAVRPDARLVLVGDPYQLASIEAGTVLGDVVGSADSGGTGPLAGSVIVLKRVHRFASDSGIAALADAIRRGDEDEAIDLLQSGRDDIEWVRPDDPSAVRSLEQVVVERAVAMARAALDGDAAAGLTLATDLKVLGATRWRDFGTYDWRERIERLASRAEPRLAVQSRWYVGRPVIVTRNDYLNRLVNGATGLVVAAGDRVMVAFPDAGADEGIRLVHPSQLASVETWWAMTIHKSQGSEYRHAVVSLPTHGSPVLTRELLYTGVTRAREKVTILGSESAIRTGISRPVARASGLRERLWH
jgi:exodeoxyribonuclease V alpha subunit